MTKLFSALAALLFFLASLYYGGIKEEYVRATWMVGVAIYNVLVVIVIMIGEGEDEP